MSHKLVYFNAPGRAYVIRAAFKIGNIPFEDSFIEFAELKANKPSSPQFPLGSAPVLHLPSGKVVTQSAAIARYAAKLSNLYPTEPEHALEVDEIVETINSDLLSSAPQNPDAETKKKLREEWAQGKLKVIMSFLSDKVAAAKGGFLVDGKRSIADLYLYSCLRGFQNGSYDYITSDYCSSWPVFDAYIKMIESDSVFSPFTIPPK